MSNTFTYNGLDTRVGKVDSSGTSTYRRDGAEVTAPVLGDGGAVYTPGVSQRRSGSTTYDLSDPWGWGDDRESEFSEWWSGTDLADKNGNSVRVGG